MNKTKTLYNLERFKLFLKYTLHIFGVQKKKYISSKKVIFKRFVYYRMTKMF